jgi:hypothetical protein
MAGIALAPRADASSRNVAERVECIDQALKLLKHGGPLPHVALGQADSFIFKRRGGKTHLEIGAFKRSDRHGSVEYGRRISERRGPPETLHLA